MQTKRGIDGSFAVSGGLVAAAISQPSPSNATAASTMHTPTGTISEINYWITNVYMGGHKNNNNITFTLVGGASFCIIYNITVFFFFLPRVNNFNVRI